MNDITVNNPAQTQIKVLSSIALLTPQEADKSDNTKKFKVVHIEGAKDNARHFNYISDGDYREVLAREEGIGVTEIIFGVAEVIMGLITLVVGVLSLQPWLIVGGVLTTVSGSLSIAAGATRAVNPGLSQSLGYSAIAVGTAGLLFSIYGGYRAGIHASRMVGRAANGRLLHSQTASTANYQMQTLASATPIPTNVVGGFNQFYGGPGFMMQLLARAAGRATTSGVNLAYGTVLGAGATAALGYAGYWHSMKKRAENQYHIDREKMILGGMD